jgi:transposase
MHVRYRVELEESERQQLEALVAGGTRGVRTVKRAQILLAAAAGCADEEIADTLRVGTSTVYRTKRRFVDESLEWALAEKPRPGGKRRLAARKEALLIATACAAPPEGRATWTLALLADALVRLTAHPTISRQTIARRLKENDLKPWQRKMWCVPRIDAQYVARMEDVLDLYTTPPAAGTRWSAWMKRRASSLRRSASRPHRRRAGRTVSIGAMGRQMCLSCWTPPPRCMRHTRRKKPAASCAASTSTTSRSTPVGSTWWKSKSAYWSRNAWIGGFLTGTPSRTKSMRGRAGGMTTGPRSPGCLASSRPARNSDTPTQPRRSSPKRPPREPVRFTETGY